MRSIVLLLVCLSSAAFAEVDFKKSFSDRDACFLVSDLKTGKTVAEYNPKRCAERFSPCSTFKVAASVMAYEKGILKDENQIIKWDGTKRSRPEENQDQTPVTWMKESIKWVTEWIMPQLGEKNIQRFLDTFNYGNKDFSGGMKDAWVTSSLKISAREQTAFISKLWKDELLVSKNASDLTRKIIFVKKLGENSELYGKTGTGCLVGHACMDRPDKMIGWFVGVLKNKSDTYIIAGNASDLKPQERPAGPRMRATAIELLTEMGLVSK
jgi:beta-lactamase class D